MKAIKTTNKAVGYLRVSTDEQRLGPEGQKAAILAWAAKEGVEVVAWYSDLGVSGAAPLDKRPGLAAAMDALNRGDTLIIAKRDRLSRDALATAMIERLVARKAARIQTADGTGNEDTPEGMLMRRMVDAFAEYERQIIKARTKAALGVKAARGERTNYKAPYGTRFDGDKVVADSREQSVARDVEALQATGWTLQAIADEMNKRGVTTRSGGPHTTSSIWRIVQGLKRDSFANTNTTAKKQETEAA